MGQSPHRPALLCLSPSFSPDTTPTAIRASKLLERISAQWDVTVVTESPGPDRRARSRVEVVRAWRPSRLLAALRRLRLGKLLDLTIWPDYYTFWLIPAIIAGRRLIRETSSNAIVVFMMPYSAGLAGLVLSRLTGLPLVVNLDDSPTCTDMHPHFPTRLHFHLARALEDYYVRRADAVIYVSQVNLDLVRARQSDSDRDKFHLVRYGVDLDEHRPQRPRSEDFEIVYVGGMTGWWSLVGQSPQDGVGRIYDAWTRLGRFERTVLDQRTSSPAIIGEAMLEAIAEHPSWRGRMHLTIYGNPYPAAVVERSLSSAGIDGIVTVFGPVAHAEVANIIAQADLLFITLPGRPDGSPGGRISAKTYEYLATDRPILAAVPPGENANYLKGKPGVWLVQPNDRQGMQRALVELAGAKLAGMARAFPRESLRGELSYATRAAQFSAAVEAAIERGLRAQATAPTSR